MQRLEGKDSISTVVVATRSIIDVSRIAQPLFSALCSGHRGFVFSRNAQHAHTEAGPCPRSRLGVSIGVPSSFTDKLFSVAPDQADLFLSMQTREWRLRAMLELEGPLVGLGA